MAQQTFSGVPGDFSAGQVLTAADMDKLREFLLYMIKDGDETDTGEVSPLIMDLGSDTVTIGGNPVQAGDWTAWTPTITNWTAGNAVFVARYAQFGKTIHFVFQMTMGDTTAFSGQPTFTLPTNVDSTTTYPEFNTEFQDVSAGYVRYTGHTTPYAAGNNRAVSYYGDGPWAEASPSVPFTWADTDRWRVTGTYEAA